MSLKKRNNKFFKLKSHVWGEVKDKNLYDYRSKNFNKLVRQIYEESGKKGVTRQTGFLIEKVEKELFFKPTAFEKEITYYDLDRTIKSLQESAKYGDYDLVTDFGDDVEFNINVNLDNWKYEGSQLQALVNRTDAERRRIGKQDTPKKHLKFVIDNDIRQIIIAVNNSELIESPKTGYVEEERKEERQASAGKVKRVTTELNKALTSLNQFKEQKAILLKETKEIQKSNLPASIKTKLLSERAKELESIRPRIKEFTAVAREKEEGRLKLKSGFIHGKKRKVKRKTKTRKGQLRKTVRKRGNKKK